MIFWNFTISLVGAQRVSTPTKIPLLFLAYYSGNGITNHRNWILYEIRLNRTRLPSDPRLSPSPLVRGTTGGYAQFDIGRSKLIPFLKNNDFLEFYDFPGRGATREHPYKNTPIISCRLLRKWYYFITNGGYISVSAIKYLASNRA